MRPFFVLVPTLLLSGVLPGCLDNPLFYDDSSDSYDQPTDYPPPGPPDVSGSASMTAATYTTRHGGWMTVSVTASNAFYVETAYDIQVELMVSDGNTQLGTASVYLGDLDAGQWTQTSVEVTLNGAPSSSTVMSLQLTWWDAYNYQYQKQINGYMLFKRPAEGGTFREALAR